MHPSEETPLILRLVGGSEGGWGAWSWHQESDAGPWEKMPVQVRGHLLPLGVPAAPASRGSLSHTPWRYTLGWASGDLLLWLPLPLPQENPRSTVAGEQMSCWCTLAVFTSAPDMRVLRPLGHEGHAYGFEVLVKKQTVPFPMGMGRPLRRAVPAAVLRVSHRSPE